MTTKQLNIYTIVPEGSSTAEGIQRFASAVGMGMSERGIDAVESDAFEASEDLIYLEAADRLGATIAFIQDDQGRALVVSFLRDVPASAVDLATIAEHRIEETK